MIWVLTQENLSLDFSSNKDADQSAQSDQCLCLSLFESIVSKLAMSEISIFS